MPDTSNSIANAAIQRIGDNQPSVTGQNPNWDSSPAGVALQKLYTFAVQTVQRRFSWDASRRTVALAATGNVAPFPFGYTGEYVYPSNGIEVWQIQLRTPADLNDPLPMNWSVGNTLVSGVQTKVIWTSLAAPYVTYNNNPTESVWDPMFREAVVTFLAAQLAEALAGKPETSGVLLQTSERAVQVGAMRDN